MLERGSTEANNNALDILIDNSFNLLQNKAKSYFKEILCSQIGHNYIILYAFSDLQVHKCGL